MSESLQMWEIFKRCEKYSRNLPKWSGVKWHEERWSDAKRMGGKVKWHEVMQTKWEKWSGVKWSEVMWKKWCKVKWRKVRKTKWVEKWSGVKWNKNNGRQREVAWSDAVKMGDEVKWHKVAWSEAYKVGVKWSGMKWSEVEKVIFKFWPKLKIVFSGSGIFWMSESLQMWEIFKRCEKYSRDLPQSNLPNNWIFCKCDKYSKDSPMRIFRMSESFAKVKIISKIHQSWIFRISESFAKIVKLAGYSKHSKDSGKNFESNLLNVQILANVTNIQKIRHCKSFECLNLLQK